MNENESKKDQEKEHENVKEGLRSDHEDWEEKKAKLKNVTIRGIDSDTYDQFSRKIRNLDMNLGDAITKMMEEIVRDLDDSINHLPGLRARTTFNNFKLERVSISHYDKLEVGKADLEEANARIAFSHISRLTFLPDVTRDVFNRYVRNVSHCDTVRIPSIFPKLILYSKIDFCEKIEIYDVEGEGDTSKNTSSKE